MFQQTRRSRRTLAALPLRRTIAAAALLLGWALLGDSCQQTPQPLHFDFEEEGMANWLVANGDAFDWQPVDRQSITTIRGASDRTRDLLFENIRGDYWDVPYPIGIQGHRWIGTGERFGERFDERYGDPATGEAMRVPFNLQGRRFVYFLIGGGCDENEVGIKLESQEPNGTWVERRRSTGRCWDGGTIGRPVERMERRQWDLLSFMGTGDVIVRITIYDKSPDRHINVDDIWVTSTQLPIERPPVWGLADAHSHPLAHLAYDGGIVFGPPNDDPSGTLAGDGGVYHGPRQSKSSACIIMYLEGDSPFPILSVYPGGIYNPFWRSLGCSHARHVGSPLLDMLDWRNKTHQQMNAAWIRRAYHGGLRLLVAEAVNNRLLAYATHDINHDGIPVQGPDTDVTSYNQQIDAIHALVTANSDFMEIALTPADARRIIEKDMLAVVLGIEVDSFANCDLREQRVSMYDGNWYVLETHPCTSDQMITLLGGPDGVYANDVRQIHLVHFADNAFGSPAVGADPVLSLSNLPINGQIFTTAPGGGGVATINAGGLRPLGVTLIREMQARGMIVAIDHMGERTTDDVLGLDTPLENAFNDGEIGERDCDTQATQELRDICWLNLTWPVALTHTAFRDLAETPQEINKRRDQIERVYQLGGIVAPGIVAIGTRDAIDVTGESYQVANTCNGTSRSFAQYLEVIEHYWTDLGFDVWDLGIPLGTDFNGLNGGVPPRFGGFACGFQLPTCIGTLCTPFDEDAWAQAQMQLGGPSVRYADNPFDTQHLSAQVWGRRTFNINVDGVVTYGMLPDFLQDLRTVGVPDDQLAHLFLGAEAYIRMWEKACRMADPALSDPGC